MNLPKEVAMIINKLYENGFEAYAVGGCVRDSLMGVEPKDYDITTDALPEQVKELFPKTFDTGIQHGTITVVENKENYEVTTYRIDGDYLDNRRPESVIFTPSLKEDLQRRDFTINAIAYNDKAGYIDFFNGREHIDQKKIIAVGDPRKRFDEDSLRIYRGVRFSCQLGFEIDEDTKKAMIEKAVLTKNLSVERIREELIKALKSTHIENLNVFLEIKVLDNYNLNLAKHFEDNISFIIEKLSSIERTTTNVLSVLFCGLEKKEIESQLKLLKLDNQTIKEVTQVFEYLDVEYDDSLYFTRKQLNKYGVFYKTIVYIQGILKAMDNYKIIENIEYILENNEPINIKDLRVNGQDMQEIGIVGVGIGKTLNFLLDEVHKNPEMNQREILIDLAKGSI